jgi:hypothetical protein
MIVQIMTMAGFYVGLTILSMQTDDEIKQYVRDVMEEIQRAPRK